MLPNFLVVGAAKSGTTSLYNYLGQHPEVYMSPVKEPHFFAFMNQRPQFTGPHDKYFNELVITDRMAYERLFDGVTNERAVGECSASYLYGEDTADNIKQLIPACRIIVILRNPIDRTYSQYKQTVMIGQETIEFEEALAKQADRRKLGWKWYYQYEGMSLYFEQVKRYIDTFGHEQVLVCLFEDFKTDSLKILRDIYQFLNIKQDFVPTMEVFNRSGMPKIRTLHHLLRREGWHRRLAHALLPLSARNWLRGTVEKYNYRYESSPEIKPETRKMLEDIFRPDILKLQALIGRDLPQWLPQYQPQVTALS